MGRNWTPEQRARQSEAIKAYWRKKKTPPTIWQRLRRRCCWHDINHDHRCSDVLRGSVLASAVAQGRWRL